MKNSLLRQLFLFASFILIVLNSSAQKGPGGVSVESGNQSTCRAWLDASTLTTLADGDDLSVWQDVSLSAASDNAAPAPNELPPFFRDNAANTINGFPVVTFEEDRFLLLQATSDLNLQQITNSKTVFFAFRTSSDITTKQVLYEEGGCWRGLNIYLNNGQVYIGAYDLNPSGVNNNGNRDGDNTPQWGYSFVSRPIQSNSTYILTMQFSAPNGGMITTNPNDNVTYIRGWLNGQEFATMDFSTANLTNSNGSNTGVNGLGTLWAHPDPIGLGAVNSDYVDADGLNCNSTGEDPFQGRLAELCYYNDKLSESERIIIENYLGAKYFANIIVNDKYDHQAGYGNEVIGIGQQTNAANNRHDLSQGRNPFLISKRFGYTSADQFFFTGHNGANLTYTDLDVPNNSVNIQRLQRIWRVDHRSSVGSFGPVNIEINTNDLPPAPAGFSKLVLLVDQTSANFPNFTLGSTVVEEIPLQAGNIHIKDYNFPDNSFFTFGWVRPEVSFDFAEASGIESDGPPATSPFIVTVSLNYRPDGASGPTTVDYIFNDSGLSAESTDYTYDPLQQSNGCIIPAGAQQFYIPFEIVNDNIPDEESTEEFQIILQNGSNTSPGLFIGTNDTLTFSILDDDPPPTASFDISSASVLENGTEFYIKVRRTGDPSDMASTSSTVRVQRISPPNQGTAEHGVDFELTNSDGWSNPSWAGANPTWRRNFITFPAAFVSSQVDSIRVVILDDNVDENNEHIGFNLFGVSNIAIDPSSITAMALNIIDDDPLPEANFITDNQTGYEAVGDPVIFVELDRPSTRDVEVSYQIIGGTATFDQDYTGAVSGTMLFAPGDTLAFPSPFNVDNGDMSGEPDETVVFQLTTGDNATIGALNQHTYTIIDYAPFEWKGAGGIGRDSDNIVWINADRMSGTGLQNSINNFSPRDIDINRANGNGNRANLQDNVINGRKALFFDGNSNTSNADMYEIDNSSFTNLAGFVEKKAFFFVMQIGPETSAMPTSSSSSTQAPTTARARLIYEQGGGTRGISIYLYQSRLYFHAWNDNNDGPQSPWGYSGNINSSTWARSQVLSINTPYVVSCIYDNTSTKPLQVWVNGQEGTMSNTITGNPLNNVGRLYSHGGRIGLGAINDNTRFHFTTSIGSERQAAFRGWIAEFIKFHEPQMNEVRRVLLENYLSAKYNIPLDNNDTRQLFDLTFAAGADRYNNEVAGVGRTSAQDIHGDSQGPLSTAMRVRNPIFANANGPGFLTWGHNGEELTNTYPFSAPNAANPSNILERSGKVWRINESSENNINTADILINFSESDSAAGLSADNTLLKLLVTTDPDNWSTASVYDANIKSGFVAEFENVTMNDGIYVALGNTSNYFNTPLPIELVSFDAKLNGTAVDLDWMTASEINNDMFVIERASDDLVWEPIMTVLGVGFSNSLTQYAEVDREPLEGLSYYRLKQIDFDGQYSYSDPVAIVNNQFMVDENFIVFPNPAREGYVFIKPPSISSGYLSLIRLFDSSGKLIHKEIYDELTDVHRFYFGKLTPGIYFIEFSNEDKSQTKKIIID